MSDDKASARGRKVWFCPNCGYEVNSRGRCFRCRERLVASPLPELAPGLEEDEVGYRLADWEDRSRGRLIVALIRANVAHRFEEEELVVGAEDEARVDDLLAELQAVLAAEDTGEEEAGDEVDEEAGVADPAGREPVRLGGARAAVTGEDAEAAGLTEQDEATAAAVAQLYGAARRLREDPTDMQADGEVAEASAGVFSADGLPGADTETWSAVGRVTRRLLGALGADEALEEEIRTQAGVLVKLLAPVVDRAPGGSAPGDRSRTRDLLAESTAALSEGRREADAALDEPGAEGPGGAAAAEGLGAADEIVYELPDWLPDQRANLSLLLDAQGIVHSWDGGDLVVPGDREEEVDALFDRLEQAEAGADEDEDGEARYRALEELFSATDRLAADADNPHRRADVIQAVEDADGPTPVGMVDVEWWQLRARARGLVEAINEGAGSVRVQDEAAAVRDLLRAIV